MNIKVGEPLPDAQIFYADDEGNPVPQSMRDFFAKKRSVIVGMPGAFTPTCHINHLPSYIEHKKELYDKGIEKIAIITVNDVFTLGAWKKQSPGSDDIFFISDGNRDFADESGLYFDGSAAGMNKRLKRFVIVIDNKGTIEHAIIENNPGEAVQSNALELLKVL